MRIMPKANALLWSGVVCSAVGAVVWAPAVAIGQVPGSLMWQVLVTPTSTAFESNWFRDTSILAAGPYVFIGGYDLTYKTLDRTNYVRTVIEARQTGSGTLVWRTVVQEEVLLAGLDDNLTPVCYPTVAGEALLVVVNTNGPQARSELVALHQQTGEVLWRRSVSLGQRPGFCWGHRPDKDALRLFSGNSEYTFLARGPILASVGAADGKFSWRAKGGSSPELLSSSDQNIYSARRRALTARSGTGKRPLWTTDFTTTSSGDGPFIDAACGSVLLQNERDVRALDANSGEHRWAVETDHVFHAATCVYAYGFKRQGPNTVSIRALRASDGSEAWSKNIGFTNANFYRGERVWESFVWDERGLAAFTKFGASRSDGSRICYFGSETGELRWCADTEGFGELVLADDGVISMIMGPDEDKVRLRKYWR